VTILKGHRTLIAMPGGKASENPTGNHGLAKGGSGDVLTGLLGGLLAQGMAPFDAARLGVYVHGLAGDIAAARVGARGMTASDVLAALPAAWRQLEA
jgi:NAD(P)H-hydrate epimerase